MSRRRAQRHGACSHQLHAAPLWLPDPTCDAVAVLTRAVEGVRTELRGCPPNVCVLASRMLLQMLQPLGVRARAVPVSVLALNRAAQQQRLAGVPIQDWPASAWYVGTAATDRCAGGIWDGHLIVQVTAPGTDGAAYRILVDPTADQYSRPQRQLTIGKQVWVASPDLLAGEPVAIFQPDGSLLFYRHAPGARAYLASSDWTGARHVTAVGALAMDLAAHLSAPAARTRRVS